MIDNVTFLVRDYDEAIDFFVGKLGFDLLADERLDETKRWVRVRPKTAEDNGAGTALLLARASTNEQRARVGGQTGGRVAFFLTTDDFQRDHQAFRSNGVRFVEQPRHESYGTVAVFEDLYGNRWDLIQKPV